MKKYFLVYNDNTHVEHLAKLILSVKQYSDFEIIIYDKNCIDENFKNKNAKILNHPRGGGYWLWKPYIITDILNKIEDGDYLFYLDSKYYFTEDFTKLYEDKVENSDVIVWANKPNEETYYMKNWCKMDVILKHDMYHLAFNENVNDCSASAIFIKKTDFSMQVMNEWLDRCCNYEDITDTESINKNDPFYYCEHRHDQSLLSITLYKNNIKQHWFEKKYLQNVRNPY
jgi:hypothetical protein